MVGKGCKEKLRQNMNVYPCTVVTWEIERTGRKKQHNGQKTELSKKNKGDPRCVFTTSLLYTATKNKTNRAWVT
jgi:hypothetical protein